MAISVKHVNICSPSSAMVTSLNEWKIPEWDENLQTKTKTYNLHHLLFYFEIYEYSTLKLYDFLLLFLRTAEE